MRVWVVLAILGAGCLERALPLTPFDASAAAVPIDAGPSDAGLADLAAADGAAAPDLPAVRAWQPAVRVNHDGFGIFGYFPAVAINASGAAVVAWREDDSMAPRRIWAARYLLGAGWQAPEAVPFSTGFVNAVSVGIDDSGEAAAALGLDPPELARYDVGSAAWQVRSLVSPPGSVWFGISPALPTPTRVVALWRENPNTGGNPGQLWTGRYDLFGWSQIAQLDPGGAEAIEGSNLSAVANGQAAAIWGRWLDHSNQIWAAQIDLATATWSSAVRLDDGSGTHPYSPSIAVDPAGNALAIWLSELGSAGTLRVRRYDAATRSWGPTANLGVSGQQPRIVAAASGEALAVWREWSAGPDTHLHYSRCLGGVWQPPQVLPLGPTGTVNDFDVAMNADGIAVLAWEILHVGQDAQIYATRLE